MLTRPRLTLRTLLNNLQKPFPELRGGMRPRLEADFRLCKRSVGRKVQRGAFLWLQCPNRSRAEGWLAAHRILNLMRYTPRGFSDDEEEP